jgi:RimJ/RimL family protein N-acetyltransferase
MKASRYPAFGGRNLLGGVGGMGQDHGMEAVELREAGLVLRPFRAGDAEDVLRACQDPLIQRWLNVPRPYLPQHAIDFVTSYTERAWQTGTGAPLGVFDAATGDLLGSNGLIMLQRDYRVGEVGYWVAPWARGRGVATVATRAVARWGLTALGLERIAWRAELGNFASRVVAHRLGFRMEGVQRLGAPRHDGHRVDCWSASLIPGELREATEPLSEADRLAVRRAATFGAPQPLLPAVTSRGATVVLRPPAERDLDAIVTACRDPETARWTTVPQPYDRSNAVYFVAGRGRGTWVGGTGIVCALADAEDRYCGSMELRLSPEDPAVGTVGYLLGPWARGLGYASAGLRTLCAWGFQALRLRRIEWWATVGNDASRRVAERAGFTMEGVVRGKTVQRGEPSDSWTGALLASDAPAIRR